MVVSVRGFASGRLAVLDDGNLELDLEQQPGSMGVGLGISRARPQDSDFPSFDCVGWRLSGLWRFDRDNIRSSHNDVAHYEYGAFVMGWISW